MTKKAIKTRFHETIKGCKLLIKTFIFLLNNRKKIFMFLVSFTFLLGLIGYILSDQTSGFFNIINSTISLFWGEFKDDKSILLEMAKSLAIICFFFGAIFLFFTNIVNDIIVNIIQKRPHNLIIGLSSQNQHYINSLECTNASDNSKTDKKSDKKSDNSSQPSGNSTLIIEANANHDAIERYRKRGFGVIASKAEETIDTLDHLDNLKMCIISTGSDRQNIALALKLIEKIPPNKKRSKRSIYVRVDNRDLSVLFQDHIKVVGSQTEKGIDLIPHSLQTIICRQLFKEHSVLGLQTKLINGNLPFHIIVVGASKLSIEIIYHLAILAHLPNQNHLTIHLIDTEAKKFCANVEKHFPGIAQIPQLKLAPLELDSESLEFYRDAIWHRTNLTNIIIATDTDDKNFDIAVNLQDTTYIQETTHKGQSHIKVLFAISSHTGLGSKISDDNVIFANFHTFGDLSQASSEGNLIDEDLELIAKLINHGYNNLPVDKRINEDDLHDEWMALSLHKKESNRAQASHMDIKLLSLGLKKNKTDITDITDEEFKALLDENRKVFNQTIPSIVETEKLLLNYKNEYFPSSFNSLPDKIARAEHNRWNAFHYLRGFKYGEKKYEQAKIHNCLKPIENFVDVTEKVSADGTKNGTLKQLYQYDLHSVVYIPLYLAHTGYQILPISKV